MNDQSTIQPVDFVRERRTRERVARFVKQANNGRFYYIRQAEVSELPGQARPKTINRLLPGRNKTQAAKDAEKFSAQYESWLIGRAHNPFLKKRESTVEALAERYIKLQCPTEAGKPREGKQLKEEIRRATYIAGVLGDRIAKTISNEDWNRYARFRLEEVRTKFKTGNRKGTRAVDLERATWNAIIFLARRSAPLTGIKENPLQSSPPLHDAEAVRHCRECQPVDADELHLLGSALFQASTTIAFQYFFEAYTGHRTHEILKLMFNAAPDAPGYVEHKLGRGRSSAARHWLFRSKTHKATFPFREIDPVYASLLEAHRNWIKRDYPDLIDHPDLPFFPSETMPLRVVDKDRLRKVMRIKCAELGLPLRIPHALRSWRVNYLRSQRTENGGFLYSDDEVGKLVGHASDELIKDVYGDVPREPLTQLPTNGPPAWNHFLSQGLLF